MASQSISLNKRAKDQGFSARFICLTGKELKDSRHPIMLQLIHQGKVRRYSTKEACSADQWDEQTARMKPRAKGAAQVNGVLSALEAAVMGIVDALIVHRSLSLDSFEARYRDPKATEDVLAFMEHLEEGFISEGRIGYAATFRTASSALGRFGDGKSIRFTDLTPRKLEEFERYLKSDGCTGGGIAAYMRTIRVAVNLAIKEGLLAVEHYPFETERGKGYSMRRLKSKFNPRALTEEDMNKLKSFPFTEAPHLANSVRLFLFSYYSRGMNFRDMAHLKRSDVYDGRILYRRRKTNDAFSIPVSDPIAQVLASFDTQDGVHLFPILGPEHRTERQQWYRIQKCLKRMNADLKEAASLVGIEAHLTSYVARHTFATTLKRKGVNIATISEAMGHESIHTTQAYLSRFGSEVLDAADRLL